MRRDDGRTRLDMTERLYAKSDVWNFFVICSNIPVGYEFVGLFISLIFIFLH